MFEITKHGNEIIGAGRYTDGTSTLIVELENDHKGPFWALRLLRAGMLGKGAIWAVTDGDSIDTRDKFMKWALKAFKAKRVLCD